MIKQERPEQVRRLHAEMRSLHRQSHPAFEVFPCEDDLTVWQLILEGPEGTPYESGSWIVYLLFPEEYPDSAPKVRFLTPVRHPNINGNGRVCHSILDRNWTPDTSVLFVLNSVYGLFLQPDISDAVDTNLAYSLSSDAAAHHAQIRAHVRKHASTPRAELCRVLTGEATEVDGQDERDLDSLSFSDLRRYVKEHGLTDKVKIGGAGRDRAAILRDLRDHFARDRS